MCLSLATSGIPFCGADIGGFTGQISSENLMKWYKVALFQPFFRTHAHNTAHTREPWFTRDYDFAIIK